MSRVTILKVAERAGVSQTTVSYVLNDRPNHGIPPETRERVRRAAAELGYRPNALARGLVRGRTNSLGFVIATLANPFFAELTDSLYRAARERGYELLIALDDGSFDQEAEHLERFLERRVDGILIWAGHARGEYRGAPRLDAQRTPYVLLGKHADDEVTSFIDVDRPAGIERAVAHLVRLGRTRIGYLGYEVGEAMHCPFPSLAPAEIRTVGYEAGARLAALPRLPEAVICGGDQIALGVIAALVERANRVPEDVAVIGFDGIADGAFSRPRLTTLAHPIAGLVEQGLATVLHLMKEPNAPPRRVTLTPELVVRESCGGLLAGAAAREGAVMP
jgi:LacI family transcriptional regulator